MSDIVWAMNPNNDKFEDVIERVRIFSNQILGAKDINLSFRFPEDICQISISAQQRKNIYLIFKEAINNIAKYSLAKNCYVTGELLDKKVKIEIRDDGVGFEANKETLGGNGLINMKLRAVELGGDLSIMSEKGKGTIIVIQF